VGEIVTFAPGETMVAFGAPQEAFFYILEGEAAAWDEVTGERYGNATLGPTQFTGEMSFLSGGTAQLTNRAVTPLTAIRVARPAMLQTLADLPEMSDIVVTVFAARRRRLIESGQAGLTLIGPEADRTVRRIEAFVAQNRIPYRAYPIGSPEALELAGRCGVPADRAAVVLGESTVLADPTPRSIARRFAVVLEDRGDAAELLLRVRREPILADAEDGRARPQRGATGGGVSADRPRAVERRRDAEVRTVGIGARVSVAPTDGGGKHLRQGKVLEFRHA
jgi:thioredoxin reductase (NADPH)